MEDTSKYADATDEASASGWDSKDDMASAEAVANDWRNDTQWKNETMGDNGETFDEFEIPDVKIDVNEN